MLEISAHLRKTGTKEVCVSGGIRKCMNQKRNCTHLSGNAHLTDSMSCSVFVKWLILCGLGVGVQRCPVLDKCSTTEQACLNSYFNKVQKLQEGKSQDSKSQLHSGATWAQTIKSRFLDHTPEILMSLTMGSQFSTAIIIKPYLKDIGDLK